MSAIVICGGSTRPGPRDTCPSPLHDWPLPAGYVSAHQGAASRLSRRWQSKRCPDCHLYGWVPGRMKGETRVPHKAEGVGA